MTDPSICTGKQVNYAKSVCHPQNTGESDRLYIKLSVSNKLSVMMNYSSRLNHYYGI